MSKESHLPENTGPTNNIVLIKRSVKQKKEHNFIRLTLEKLHEGTPAFNQWRLSQGEKWIRLTDHDFSGWNLDGINLKGAKLTGSNFTGASLKGANFLAANLNKADFTEANLSNSNLQGSRMHQTRLDRAIANGCIFFASLRENWSIRDITCDYCWIAQEPDPDFQNFDSFAPGEFELTYGGARFRVRFSDDFAPIDLLALPFYAKDILSRFPDKKLVFSGLSALGDPSLEFRVDNGSIKEDVGAIQTIIQTHFDSRFRELREVVEGLVAQQLAISENRVDTLIDTLSYIQNTKSRQQQYYITMGDTYIQKQGVQGRKVSDNQIFQINTEDLGQVNRLAEELERLHGLIESLPSASSDEIAAVSEAAEAARAGDGKTALNRLKSVGKWMFTFCEKVGVSVAAAAIRQATGI